MQSRCVLSVGYGNIFANLLFLSLRLESPGIPVERFPDFAIDVRRMMEAADVTEEFDALRVELPFLE